MEKEGGLIMCGYCYGESKDSLVETTSRQSKYIERICALLGRPLKGPFEFGKFGHVIKVYPNEVLDKALSHCMMATNVTDLGKLFIYKCSEMFNKVEIDFNLPSEGSNDSV